MLTVDGVLKAVDAAIRQLRENYQESDLKIWVDAHKMVRHAIRDASGENNIFGTATAKTLTIGERNNTNRKFEKNNYANV